MPGKKSKKRTKDTNNNESKGKGKGERLLNAVETIVASSDSIIALVKNEKKQLQARYDNDDKFYDAVATKLISHYSNKSAIAGGATALPAMMPGAGTLLAFIGGALADMALMLKYEVEMSLALTHLYGFNIRLQHERQLAFLLASVSTYESKSGRNFFVDLAAAEATAVWNYTPRQVGKYLASAMAELALLSAGKGFSRMVPVLGVVVIGSANKLLTTHVGKKCRSELRRRRKLTQKVARGDVVDARVDD
jgi:hypothetical protein